MTIGKGRTAAVCATLVFSALVAVACAKKSGIENVNLSVAMHGTVKDYVSGAAIPNAVIKSIGLLPELTVEAGADGTFTLEPVPVNGYVILSVAAPGHLATLNPALLVEETDLTGVVLQVIGTSDAAALETGFGVVETSGRGQILGRTAFETGSGIAGVQSIQLLPVGFSADGPHFLDMTGAPSGSLTATTSNGGFTFFNVTTGNIAVQASAPNFLFQSVATVSRPATWSIVSVVGAGGTVGSTPTPTPSGTPATVSFASQVDPIFTNRGCKTCHRKGNAAGGLRLDQAPAKDYTALNNLAGVLNAGDPAASLLLKKPLFEAASDHGGGNIFLTTSDPDYVTILNWITQGANNN